MPLGTIKQQYMEELPILLNQYGGNYPVGPYGADSIYFLGEAKSVINKRVKAIQVEHDQRKPSLEATIEVEKWLHLSPEKWMVFDSDEMRRLLRVASANANADSAVFYLFNDFLIFGSKGGHDLERFIYSWGHTKDITTILDSVRFVGYISNGGITAVIGANSNIAYNELTPTELLIFLGLKNKLQS